MVLQRDLPVVIWGWADPDREVVVSFAGQTEKARSDTQGQWRVQLQPLASSKTPSEMLIRAGTETVDFNDILVGEVWLCSGQSNMEWILKNTDDAEAVIAASDFPLIRHIKTQRVIDTVPRDDVKLQTPWQRCSPAVAAEFTAVGYYFARHLQEALDVPIGLVNSSWGGSNIESFTSLEGFKAIPELEDIVRRVESSLPDHPTYERQLRDILDQTRTWIKQAESALANKQRVPNPPALPKEVQPLTNSQDPTVKYNAMIRGLAPYRIRGVIWYQGESNRQEGLRYVQKTEAQLISWRGLWGQPDLPYYYVQIAPYQYGEEDPHILAAFWEAQAAIEQDLPHTHMTVINDVGNLKDIHPRNKKTVGARLGAQALVHTYGQEGVAQGPAFDTMRIQEDRLILAFTHTGGGLTTRDGKDPNHFEIAGENGVFVPALARIRQNRIVLRAEGVSRPVAMRFAWHKLAEPNLCNKEGFPASAFRAGTVPERGLVDASVPQARDYRLVYSHDIGSSGTDAKQAAYRVNASREIDAFDRVAYFLALQPPGEAIQWIWVSMDAFTDDAAKLGIPVTSSGAHFQQWVTDMAVASNVTGVTTGNGLEGYLEFWPHNYGQANTAEIPGASDTAFDFGDTPGNPQEGYGSMQIHLPGQKQTLLAYNHWSSGNQADVGIGNSPEGEPDFTFRGNAGDYPLKRLLVLVREK
jgi:sialate O-acetylesterase